MRKFLEASIILSITLALQPAKALPNKDNFTNNDLSLIANRIDESFSEESSEINQNSVDSFQSTNNQEYMNPVSETQDSRIEQIVFNFDNSYDYGTCLDAILLAYENRGLELQNAAKNDCTEQVFSVFDENLSQDTTLQLIELANYHATNELDLKLYPAWGLRRRVAINFGYIYDIDRNNNDILKYVSSNQ